LREGIVAPYIPPLEEPQFAHAETKRSSPWKLIFRFVRWSTYAVVVVTLILALHKTPPPPVETNPQAAARAEQKFEDAERAVANGQAATIRVDETELNSFLSSHLELADKETAKRATPAAQPRDPDGSAPTAQDVEQMRSNVRDFKIQLEDDRVRAYVLFDVHGKDMTLQLEGRLGAQDGYLNFQPVSGQIGSLPIPQSTLESAVRRVMESPENREKLKLPPQIADLRIENGEVVASYR
jgi:hypothetical protein